VGLFFVVRPRVTVEGKILGKFFTATTRRSEGNQAWGCLLNFATHCVCSENTMHVNRKDAKNAKKMEARLLVSSWRGEDDFLTGSQDDDP
jgi:hypothetical protein